ncbi:helix-turn-helix domain-containing protein [Nakamurella flavida]|uniref:Helix-turn-helix domain-containing protein n=1 Tax=Nakamurella flavida TaxID=363630 RepID=A0A938YMG9_9ACTN|nr:helix-turn-helix transcriptional regulator [Nakamurella flavida]MBM9477408.1 helix-turn-helix domain-containing protein [Nakamurella flavida]MDP9777341.1 transcriptional regulator with XRE-family HTH domain [Nakamurella flavida]
MSAPESPSVRERRLAHELREARVQAGFPAGEVARLLGWSASKVSRIETGRIGISGADLDAVLAVYALSPEHAAHLRRLAPSARTRGWWDAHAESLSPGYAGLLRLEAGSSELRTYCAVLPHALLMTPEYVRRVVGATWQVPSPAETDRRIRVCLRRQEVLPGPDGGPGPNGLTVRAVIDEAVLRRAVGGDDPAADRAVRRGQLRHLLELAARPGVDLRVLPFAAGIPPVSAGSFSVLTSRATARPDVVYLENKTRISFVEADTEVHRYVRDHELLTAMALPRTRSREFLAAVLDEPDDAPELGGEVVEVVGGTRAGT